MSPVRRTLARHRALPTPIPVVSEYPVVTQPDAPLPFSLLPREAAALCARRSYVAVVKKGATLDIESRRTTRHVVGVIEEMASALCPLFVGVLKTYSKFGMRSIPGTG